MRAPTVLPAPGVRAGTGRIASLDGIRGVAIIAVVVFHLWPSVAPGGFVGVSVFFTLSGFVITRSLLGEHRGTGRIALGGFWARRARRLLPASLVTLLGITLVWVAAGWSTRDLGRDLLASLGQVANWRSIATGREYGADLDSPVAHFWSLAIEEQFYLIVPIVFVALRCRRGPLIAAFATLTAVSGVLTWVWSGETGLVYYATPTRAGEIAVGCIAALVLDRRAGRSAADGFRSPTFGTPSAERPGIRRGVLDLVGVASVGAVVAASLLTSIGDDAWYRGGLLALTLASAGLIISALGGGRVCALLSLRPLVGLGTISYGVYLVHWPVDVALRRTTIDPSLRPWLSLLATLLLAVVSYRVMESPITSGRVPSRRFAAAAAAMALVIGGSAVGVTAQSPRSHEIDFDSARAGLARHSSSFDEAEPVGDPVRVAVFGDSTALMLGFGLKGASEQAVYAAGFSDLGCPIGRGGRTRGDITVPGSFSRPGAPYPERCDWSVQWPAALADVAPIDVAVVLVGNWDIVDREIPALGQWRRIGDPDYDAWLAGEIRAAIDSLHLAGVREVAWLTLPVPVNATDAVPIDRYNEIVAEVVATVPSARILDYAGHLTASGDGAAMRPDGTHLSGETASIVARRWLVPLLVAIGHSLA